MLNSRKEKNWIIFSIEENGKIKEVKYDLNTGKTYGFSGREVKNINSQLKGYTIQSLINTFEDEKYRKFLKFLNDKVVNHIKSSYQNGYRNVGTRVTNIGTFLSQINHYRYIEQYFSAGIEDIDPNFKHNINELPKGLIMWLRDSKVCLTERVYQRYKMYSNEYGEIERIKNNFEELRLMTLEEILIPEIKKAWNNNWYEITEGEWGSNRMNNRFKLLVEEYRYNKIRLLSYIDDLITFEGLGGEYQQLQSVLSDLIDYNRMMTEISTYKYEKYPKNFLSVHAITCRNYNRLKKNYKVEDFAERICLEYEITIDNYSFIYPKTPQDIKDEAVQQTNCVASYINKVMNGDCHIMFMRYKNTPQDSLVTLEIRGDKVVQKRGRFNRETTDEENKYIAKFEKHLHKVNLQIFENNKKNMKLIKIKTEELKRKVV